MHIWHHMSEFSAEKPYGVNFGINLSLWDYQVGTAHIPHSDRDIEQGFENVAQFPDGFIGQALPPLKKPNRNELSWIVGFLKALQAIHNTHVLIESILRSKNNVIQQIGGRSSHLFLPVATIEAYYIIVPSGPWPDDRDYMPQPLCGGFIPSQGISRMTA